MTMPPTPDSPDRRALDADPPRDVLLTNALRKYDHALAERAAPAADAEARLRRTLDAGFGGAHVAQSSAPVDDTDVNGVLPLVFAIGAVARRWAPAGLVAAAAALLLTTQVRTTETAIDPTLIAYVAGAPGASVAVSTTLGLSSPEASLLRVLGPR